VHMGKGAYTSRGAYGWAHIGRGPRTGKEDAHG
jgi:hypothetical protein